MEEISHYFDYAATTPVLPEVLQVMQPYFSEKFGNPSSAHAWGQDAFKAMEESRCTVAGLFEVRPAGVIFTSCSTEASNLILHDRVMKTWTRTKKPGHILTTPLEHSAVINPLRLLEEYGLCEVEELPVDSNGLVDPDDVKKHLRTDTILTTIIWANNEIGTINPIREIGQICREAGVWFHSDATQYAAHRHCSLAENYVDSIAISAHKAYGPKGIGALICADASTVSPLITGGMQENAHRAGTQNVPYIVGASRTFKMLDQEMATRVKHEIAMRDLIIMLVLNNIPGSKLTGHASQRLANHASFAFKGIDSRLLQALLDQDGFAVSVGSACKAGTGRGQYQLKTIGLSDEWAEGGLRITNGIHTNVGAVESLVTSIKRCVEFLRDSE